MDLHEIYISKAQSSDYLTLTEISFASKRYWKYPDHFYEIWEKELTITNDYIDQNIVYKAVYQNSILGFYSIIENKSDFYSGDVFVNKGYWLEHLFIRPDFLKQGIGRIIIDHAKALCISMRIDSLMIFVDPFASGFYDKVGVEYLYNSKSSIPDRMIPVCQLKV